MGRDGGATSQVHGRCKGLTSEVTDWQVVTSLFDEKTLAECLWEGRRIFSELRRVVWQTVSFDSINCMRCGPVW